MIVDYQDYQTLVSRQRDFFLQGGTRDITFRISQLNKLKQSLAAHENLLLEALRKDLGKSYEESYLTEIGLVRHEINYMTKNLRRFAKIKRVKTPLIYPGASSYIISEPRGIVLIITPWNYPVQLPLGALVGAIAAGNCVVLKPSEFAPATGNALSELIKDCFPEHYVSLLEGDAEMTKRLLEQKFDYIFFTGGLRVGKIIARKAAETLTPITLELGGKSPCIVEPDANLEVSARRIVWGKFINAGQTCIAPDYLLVHTSIKKQMIAKMKAAITDSYGDDPGRSPYYPRIVNDMHFKRLEKMLREGQIITGGEVNQAERYIAPTLIEKMPADAMLMQEEIFGPILPVLEYEDLEEALNLVREKPKPLALYFFSSNREKQKYIVNSIEAGGVCINDTLIQFTNPELPFGGVGESGIGSYHGQASYSTFSHQKSVIKNPFRFDISMKYPPFKLGMSKIKRLLRFINY